MMNQNSQADIDRKKRTILAADLELKFKIVLVGDSNVGKTSLFWRYIEDYYEDDAIQESTVTMVDFRMKNQIIDDDLVKLYIWDTAGQERYRSVIGTYFKGAHAVIGVFDVTNLVSFMSLCTHWVNQCKEKSQDAIFFLVGNKKDLRDNSLEDEDAQRNSHLNQKYFVTQNEIDKFCRENNVNYIEVSAKSGENVEELFIQLAKSIKKKFFDDQKKQQEAQQKQKQQQQKQYTSKLQPILDEERPSFALEKDNNKNKSTLQSNKNSGSSKSGKSKSKGGCC